LKKPLRNEEKENKGEILVGSLPKKANISVYFFQFSPFSGQSHKVFKVQESVLTSITLKKHPKTHPE
jgi:hypothetical protein